MVKRVERVLNTRLQRRPPTPADARCRQGSGFMNSGPARHSERVLLVDDNDARRKGTTVLLRRLGYDVVHTSDSRAGFRELLVEGADLLLAAASMPHFSGVELATVTKKLRPEMHVLLMVGDSKSFRVVSNDSLDTVKTLSVPCDPEEICAKVRSMLDGVTPGEADPPLVGN